MPVSQIDRPSTFNGSRLRLRSFRWQTCGSRAARSRLDPFTWLRDVRAWWGGTLAVWPDLNRAPSSSLCRIFGQKKPAICLPRMRLSLFSLWCSRSHFPAGVCSNGFYMRDVTRNSPIHLTDASGYRSCDQSLGHEQSQRPTAQRQNPNRSKACICRK